MEAQANEPRKRPGVEREYANEEIVVFWKPALCIHSRRCLSGLPEVFDVRARPWVQVNNASADRIAKAIQACPTGALSYERRDGQP